MQNNGIDWNLDLRTLPPDAQGNPVTAVWMSHGELQYRYGWPEGSTGSDESVE